MSVSGWCQRLLPIGLSILAVAGLLCLFASLSGRAAVAEAPVPFTQAYYPRLSDRFGVGLNRRITVTVDGTTRGARITDYDVQDLEIGWYSDWSTSNDPLTPGGIRYVQLIEIKARKYPTNTLGLAETIASNPGAIWIIGNEPEAKYSQGNRTPGEYADIYHHLHTLIKSSDPTAWVAIGGVIQPTPLRLQWLDEVLEEYETRYGQPMPVDVWNIHVQILQERLGDWGAEIPAGLDATEGRLYTFTDNANPEIFRQLVIEFRQWMKERGFQNKPLIISEYGVLMPSSYIGDGDAAEGDQQLIRFMRETFNFLVTAADPHLGYPADGNRLVQQWLWYSLNSQLYDPETGWGFNGPLFSSRDPSELTVFGSMFRQYMYALLGRPRALLPIVVQNNRPQG